MSGVLYLLKSGCQWRMLPADFPDWRWISVERAARPGAGFHSASPKKNRLARPDKAMGGKSRPASVSWTPRASSMTRAKRCPESSVISRSRLPHAIQVTPPTLPIGLGLWLCLTKGRPQPGPECVGPVVTREALCCCKGILGASVEVVKRSELHTFGCCRNDGWWSGLSPGWKSAAGSGRTVKESSIPVQMVVLAFATLILRRL